MHACTVAGKIQQSEQENTLSGTWSLHPSHLHSAPSFVLPFSPGRDQLSSDVPAAIRTVDSSILRKLPRIQWIVYLNSTDPSKNILQYSEYNFFSHEKQQIQVIQIVHDKEKQIVRKTVQYDNG